MNQTVKSQEEIKALDLAKNYIVSTKKHAYSLETKGKITEADFLKRWKEKVKPHMDVLHEWLLEKKLHEMILDSSKTKEAVNYCLNRWKKTSAMEY